MRRLTNPAIAQWHQLRQHKSFTSVEDEAIERILNNLYERRHGHFDDWLASIANLPSILNESIALDRGCPLVSGALSDSQGESLTTGFQSLKPWRKGPFQIGEMYIDSEWRSDFKYERLQQLPIDLSNKHILDVGTGNGYFLYRLLGSGAKLAVGVDPSWHYFAQFLALQHYFSQSKAIYLPMTLDDVMLNGFDIVMSMGVLYHRRDPMQHLWQLRESVRSGGHLIIETLVVDGDEDTVMLPKDRYAGMPNVWFLLSVAALEKWLTRLKFDVLAQSEVVTTTKAEQRSTAWMDRQSLADFLHPNGKLTKEGLPAPKRVMMLAQKY